MTADQWWALVEKNPDDAEVRLAFANWLQDEQNDPAGSEALRWMLRTGKRPMAGATQWLWWLWWTEDAPRADTLPHHLFAMLTGNPRTVHRSYVTRRAAEEALLDAFRLAVAKGWRPED